MDFVKFVSLILNEQNVAGGISSAFGSGVEATASAKSGDTYAPNNARRASSLYGSGIVTRFGMSNKKSKARQKRSKKTAHK